MQDLLPRLVQLQWLGSLGKRGHGSSVQARAKGCHWDVSQACGEGGGTWVEITYWLLGLIQT